jgi:hypothetical protein
VITRRAKPMRRSRYLKCLELLNLPQTGLAEMVGCSGALARQWGAGVRSVPKPIEDWLEACVKIRLKTPLPKPPRDWRRRPPRARGGKPRVQIGTTKLW